jgi:hypothetical protein
MFRGRVGGYFHIGFGPGGERANLISSMRARWCTPAAFRLSSVAIAVALSPAVPIDRSSASSSGVHGGRGALISSPSARARKLATATDGFKLGVQSTIFNGEPINDLPLLILWDCGGFRCGLSRRRRWKSLVVASKPRVGLRYRLTLGRLCNRSPGRHAK